MNNFFNFNIPYFCDKYGNDWSDFTTITDENVDYSIGKIWDLYKLADPNFFTTPVAELVGRSLDLSFDTTDTLKTKKYRIRKFLTMFKDKGTDAFYLDPQESIVGTRGVIYSSLDYGSWIWEESTWGDTDGAENILWSGDDAQFFVYIDCKTTDNDLLDQIVDAYSAEYMLPAFYKIYLIDSNFEILRSV